MGKTFKRLIPLVCILGICLIRPGEFMAADASTASTAAASQTVPAAQFHEAVLSYLCDQLDKSPTDIIISRLKVLGNRPVPAGRPTLQVFQKDKKQLKGVVQLIGVIQIDGVPKSRVRISAWVDLFDHVLCVTRHIKRGETIGNEDVYLSRMNVSRVSDNLLTRADQAIGRVLRHNVKKETCLTGAMLEMPAIIDRGAMVMILAESGCLRITTPGKALMDGEAGELIRVQNLMSNKEIYAKILDNSTVIVDF